MGEATAYKGVRFTDDDAKLFVKGFLEHEDGTLEEGTIDMGTIVDCATHAWETFTQSTDEERERYNDLEQLRWVYVVLHELVGDERKVPHTWQ